MAGANDYLAMYLQIQTGFNTPTHFIPIMHFAESASRLRSDIENNDFYKNEVRLGQAVERINNQNPFKISVLFWSTLPANIVILAKSGIRQMSLMAADIDAVLNPPQTTPIISSPEISMVKILVGMKNKTTPYPKDFVQPSTNFNSGRFVIQFAQTKVRQESAFIGNDLFTALTFYHVTGQIFMSSYDP